MELEYFLHINEKLLIVLSMATITNFQRGSSRCLLTSGTLSAGFICLGLIFCLSYIYIYICIHGYICIPIWYLYLYTYTYIYIYIYIYIHIYTCIYIHIYIYIYIYIYPHTCVSVWLGLTIREELMSLDRLFKTRGVELSQNACGERTKNILFSSKFSRVLKEFQIVRIHIQVFHPAQDSSVWLGLMSR